MAEAKFRGLNAITSEVLSIHAQREAYNTGSELIQPEHLILGILSNYPAKSRVFAEQLNIELSEMVSELARHISPAQTSRVLLGDLPPSQSMLSMLGKAANHARSSSHEYVDVSHLLFVSANEEGTPFSDLLKKHNVSGEHLEASLESFIDDSFQQPGPETDPGARMKSLHAAAAVMKHLTPLTGDMKETERIALENHISLAILESYASHGANGSSRDDSHH